MSAADNFFRALGLATVDQRLERIAVHATALRKRMESGVWRRREAVVNRWAVRQLDLCHIFRLPPPIELVRLVEYLLGVDVPERNGTRKNREKFIAAAHHVAQHLDATPAQIARAIKYDQKRVIKSWLEDPEFQKIVGTLRLRPAHQQKKDT